MPTGLLLLSTLVRTAVVFVAVLSMAGCASRLPAQAPLQALVLPTAWSVGEGPTAASELQRWWQRFDDPLLEQLVLQAQTANPRVLGAQALLRQTRALRDLAQAGLLPVLGAVASVQQGSSGGRSTGQRLAVGLDANWRPDLAGQAQHALAAADANSRARPANLGDTRLQVAVEVALDYIVLRGQQARLAIALDNLALQQETLQFTRWRGQAGLLSGLETDQAAATVQQTAATLLQLRTAIEQSRHALALLTGQAPLALNTLLAEPVPPLPMLPLPADPWPAIPAETLRQRPDVRAAEFEVTAAMAAVMQADAALQPSFTLGGSIGLNALTLASLASRAALVSNLLAAVEDRLFSTTLSSMATINFSVPEAVKQAFNAAFQGRNKSGALTQLLREASARA